jgi:hypothetical protein
MLDKAFPDTANYAGNSPSHALEGSIWATPVANSNRRPRVEHEEAVSMLKRYEELNHHFPFVVLPQQWTLSEMLRTKPILALGIFSAMSSPSVAKQRSLCLTFQRVLSERLIINGDKSLDLLQGLLVHLAWYRIW